MRRFTLLILLFSVPCLVRAALGPDPLFQSDDVLDITLSAPFDRIDRERDKDLEYDGTLTYTDQSGQQVVLDVAFSVRGNWRLDRRNCVYSQLWINLKRGQLAGTLFENQNRLKLVVQCRKPNRYSDYVIREFKAYQMFSELSDIYFDARLFNVSFTDSENSAYSRTQLAFFIEHQDRLAERFNLEPVELHEVPREVLQPDQSTVVALFQYMLGNWDFSMIRGPQEEDCCHNAKMLVNEAGEHFVIPYDFDSSGYIDATYAPPPDPAFNLRDSKIRVYRGFCVPEEILLESINRFQSSRQKMMAILQDTSYMSQRSVNNASTYISGFFDILENPRRVEQEFVRDCR